MDEIAIRNLEDDVVHGLQLIAWQRGTSLDDTVRRILIEAVAYRRRVGAVERFFPCTD